MNRLLVIALLLSTASEAEAGEKAKTSPFTEPQKRSKRIRANTGAWNPIVDVTDVFPGNRALDRQGVFKLFDTAIGVKLRVEPAERSAPLLEATAEWERGKFIGPLFIWRADGLLHMIYECSRAEATAYATSTDGYRWTRPELGQVEFDGSSANNLLRNGIRGATGVFIDPQAPPEERFKAMGGDMAWYDPATLQPLEGEEAMRRWNREIYEKDAYQGPRAEIWGRTLGWISADGRDWKPLEKALGNRPVNGGISAHYDEANGEYIAYQQIMGNTAELMPGIGTARIEEETQRRVIGFSRTKDFRTWPAPKLILAPDALDDLDISFYGANYFPYPGRTDLHVMVIPVYHQRNDHVDTQIAFSRDGLFWIRPERRPRPHGGPRRQRGRLPGAYLAQRHAGASRRALGRALHGNVQPPQRLRTGPSLSPGPAHSDPLHVVETAPLLRDRGGERRPVHDSHHLPARGRTAAELPLRSRRLDQRGVDDQEPLHESGRSAAHRWIHLRRLRPADRRRVRSSRDLEGQERSLRDRRDGCNPHQDVPGQALRLQVLMRSRSAGHGKNTASMMLGVCAVGMIVARKRGIEARFSRFGGA